MCEDYRVNHDVMIITDVEISDNIMIIIGNIIPVIMSIPVIAQP